MFGMLILIILQGIVSFGFGYYYLESQSLKDRNEELEERLKYWED